MNDALKKAYRKNRAEGMNAKNAIEAARWRRDIGSGPLKALRFDTEVEFEQDGFDIKVRVESDTDGWWSGNPYGMFTSDRSNSGVIKHTRGGYGAHKYFLPENTEEEHYRELIELKYSRREARRLAREYVKQDYERACDYGSGWEYVGIIAIASKEGVELGRDSVWSVENDDSDHVIDMANETVTQAIGNAERNLATLKESA